MGEKMKERKDLTQRNRKLIEYIFLDIIFGKKHRTQILSPHFLYWESAREKYIECMLIAQHLNVECKFTAKPIWQSFESGNKSDEWIIHHQYESIFF